MLKWGKCSSIASVKIFHRAMLNKGQLSVQTLPAAQIDFSQKDSCIGCKFSHQVAPLYIGCKFSHQMKSPEKWNDELLLWQSSFGLGKEKRGKWSTSIWCMAMERTSVFTEEKTQSNIQLGMFYLTRASVLRILPNISKVYHVQLVWPMPDICHFLYTGRIFKFQSLPLKTPKIYP